ncbi:DUF3313 domain-containing protein [Lonsdalea quercina]|uniref:DUF3313 domain-containing protein n=1 Tax=Lonsdalea quercina TaxID=71657 RepID=UPI0039769071
MSILTQVVRSSAMIVAIALAGCAGTQPARYAGIESSSQWQPNTGAESDRIPFRYAAPVDWTKYTHVILDPVTVYPGNDNQFGDMDPNDRLALAKYMQDRFSESLRSRFTETKTPTPAAIRIKLTLTGAETTTQVVGTVTKFDLAGGPYNIVQALRGKEGMLSGSVSYAVEIYDAASHRLLNAYVAKQYPNAMNVGATIGSLSAAEVGIDKGADELVDMLKSPAPAE